MRAVSPELLQTIRELQSLPSLVNFALGGGTNLALQYDHRLSDDIDLFCPNIIGKAGFAKIQEEVSAYYGVKASGFDDPCDINDQFCFLRFFIQINKDLTVKVELLQNMKNLYEVELKDGIRLLSKKDIGLFKLVSAVNRSSQKDIYDLDFITNDIALVDLYKDLEVKCEKFNTDADRTIFDLDEHQTPIGHPELLLIFDSVSGPKNLPTHSHDKLDVVEGNKPLAVSKVMWRSKVRRLYEHLDMDFPKPQGIPIK